MLERAEEIRRSKMQAEKGTSKASSHYSSGFGSSSNTSSYSTSSYDTPSYDNHSSNYSSSSYTPTPASNPSKPNKALKLGSNKDALPAFIEQQIKQAMPPNAQISSSSSSAASSAPAVHTEKVHVKVDEKINLTCGKDGGVQNLEVLGVLSVRIASEDDGRVRINLRNNDNRNLQIQVFKN